MDVEYRVANDSDFERVVNFVDFWLSGGGVADGVPGAGHDFFVPRGRHEKYFAKYAVLLAIYEGEIVGWAVKTKKGVLIHLLVAGTFRGNGIGGEMLRRMDPDSVRSKFDQSTGDPSGFYRKNGFVPDGHGRQGKKQNIELFTKKDLADHGGGKCKVEDIEDFERGGVSTESGHTPNQRSIDIMKKKLGLGNFHPERFLD